MPISVLTSKGQMTIPKEVRDALNLKSSDKVLITVERNHAVLKPIHGNILDIGGSIKIPEDEKPINFHKVRKVVRKRIAHKVAEEMGE